LSNGDTIFLRSFPSEKIGEFLKMARQEELIDKSVERVHATGGGAFKYQEVFEKEIGTGSELGIKLVKHDEMETLVNGMSFVLNYAKDSAFNWIGGEKKYLREG
jgi:pantothenate kinase